MKKNINILTIFLFLTACSHNFTKPLNLPELTNDGVNSLNAKTPYEIRFIMPNILGYEIDKLTTFKNAKTANIMRVHYHKNEVMIITPTVADKFSKRYIKNIIVTSDYIKNPFDLKIGDMYKKEDFLTCTKSKQNLICKKKSYDNIKIIFNKNSNNNYLLKEFIWSKDV